MLSPIQDNYDKMKFIINVSLEASYKKLVMLEAFYKGQ